jgi:hypothetical protein
VSRLREFVAFDGESVGQGKQHRYAILAASTGDVLENPAGIDTAAAFEFLLNLKSSNPQSIFVAFGLNYDVNMMLRGVGRRELDTLWKTGAAELELGFETYLVEWIPGKMFNVRDGLGQWFRSFDVFGFFQQPVVDALTEWGLEPGELVQAGKAARGRFRAGELDTVRRYCLAECDALAALCEQLRARLHAAGVRPRMWHGAGSVASNVMRKAGVLESLPAPSERAPVMHETILRAYYGGRTEVFRQGLAPAAVRHDIRSAYASAVAELPPGVGTWKRRREYDPDARYAIWRVEWSLRDELELLAPFPFRHNRAIYYPLDGAGWYHAPEVAAALALYPDEIRVSSGYVFEPAGRPRPFEFVDDLYAARLERAAAADPVATVLKYALAGVWGKLAQGSQRDGRRPAFQDFYLAGHVTATIRARVMLEAARDRATLAAITTDGVLFVGDPGPPAELGDRIGEWSRACYRDLFLVHAGVFEADELDAQGGPVERVAASSGFSNFELDWRDLRERWLADGPLATVQTRARHFRGIGTCSLLRDYSKLGQWVTERSTMLVHAARKFYLPDELGELRTLLPPAFVRRGLSEPYEPKTASVELDPELVEWIVAGEQPMIGY